MRILITADPHLPVPPTLYGGIERIIDSLVRGLVGRGHAVSLVAHPASRTPARLHGYGCPAHRGYVSRTRELLQLSTAVAVHGPWVDLVHSFGRLAGLAPILPLRRLPKVQSYQREIPWPGVRRAMRVAGASLRFTACSTAMCASGGGPAAGTWETVHNAVDPARYTAVTAVAADAPLVFLGRFSPVKGAHTAIRIAAGAGRRLVLAGLTEPQDAAYFERDIRPHIDGDRVRHVGTIDDAGKNTLLGGAAALLMPIAWEEPFGIVMVEAMACGTPVIGFARGSVPEVVRDGIAGFVCETVDEAIAAVRRLDRLDRRVVRRECEARFSADAMVTAYERVYARAIAAVRGTPEDEVTT